MNEERGDGSVREIQAEMARTRTVLAMDRTLLAWIRTSLSLIAFGFTLARFVHDLLTTGALHGVDAQYPRELGITLMVLGIAGLFAGAFDHLRSIQRLRTSVAMSVWSASLVVALIVAVVSVWLMVSLFTNLSTQ